MAPDINKAYEFATYIRIKALQMALNCGKSGCHIGGSFSCIEIFAVLFSNFKKHNPNNPIDINRDRFFASKAHCILSHYAALAKVGFLEEEDLNNYRLDGGLLTGHPFNLNIGLEFSGGSLGMGLSLGVGTALSAKRKKFDYKTYVLLGDGECNEGAIWEALMSATQYKLDNLIIIIDYNNMQFDGKNSEIMSLKDLKAKLDAFGCETKAVNGHSIEELVEAFSTTSINKPLAIIAKTIKANGIKRLENTVESHFTSLTQEDYDNAIADIKGRKNDRI